MKRSPGYPVISLEEAIVRAKILWEKDQSNPIPVEVVYEHLGYKHQGGYSARVLAALKKFDLISESKGIITLTEKAIDLCIHEPTDEDYRNILREIALKPDIYRKIFDSCNGSLPSEASLKIRLIKEHDFNPVKVDGFIRKFKQTISFAGLGPDSCGEKQREIDSDEGDEDEETQKREFTDPKKERESGGATSSTIFLSNKNKVILTFEKLPISAGDLARLKSWIDIMEGPLTESEEN